MSGWRLWSLLGLYLLCGMAFGAALLVTVTAVTR